MHEPLYREICPTNRALALVLVVGLAGCSGSSTAPSGGGGSGDVDSAAGGDGSSNRSAGGHATGGGRNDATNGETGGAAVTSRTNGKGGATNTSLSEAAGGASRPHISAGGSATTGGDGSMGTTTTSGNGLGGAVAAGGSAALGGSAATGGKNLGGAVATGGKNLGGAVTSGGSAGTGGSAMNSGTSTVGSSILVPETGALLGLYYGDESITATTNKLGRTAPLHLTYYAWDDDWTRGNTAEDLRAGRIPFVNWELFGAVLDEIIAGNDDAMITQRAVAAKNLNQKLFLDFGAEMNGDWSPWSGAQNGESSAKYIAAYRHVHDIFVTNGATNVIWAFCPNVTSEPDEDWNDPLDFYPGDNYVDWTCVDGYNWGTSESWSGWQSFYEVFQNIYPVLAAKNKPIMIGEMASTELGGDKATWIAQLVPTLKTKFPLIKGLIWFDINKETDWRISSSAESEAAFKAMANDPWFAR